MVRMGRDEELWWKVVKGEALQKAKESAACTHNHPEGIKGAQATALCIFMARKGDERAVIRDAISREFGCKFGLSVCFALLGMLTSPFSF